MRTHLATSLLLLAPFLQSSDLQAEEKASGNTELRRMKTQLLELEKLHREFEHKRTRLSEIHTRNARYFTLDPNDDTHQDKQYFSRPSNFSVSQEAGVLKLERNHRNLATPRALIKLIRDEAKLSYAHSYIDTQWQTLASLFSNTIPNYQKLSKEDLTNQVWKKIKPMIEERPSWIANPHDLYFAYIHDLDMKGLDRPQDLWSLFALEDMKRSTDPSKSAFDYLLHGVIDADIESGKGIESLVLEAANKRKFEDYLLKYSSEEDIDKAWAFVNKFMGVKAYTAEEKKNIEKYPGFLAKGNLYRIDGAFLARTYLNTKKVLQIRRIKDPNLRKQAMDKFYGSAKKCVFALSSADPNSVTKSGLGLGPLVRQDELGELKLFMTLCNDTKDFEGDSNLADVSILRFLDLIGSQDKLVDYLAIWGHGNKQALNLNFDTSHSGIGNPNNLDIADGALFRELGKRMAEDGVLELISCSTLRPYTKQELDTKFGTIDADLARIYVELDVAKSSLNAIANSKRRREQHPNDKQYHKQLRHYERQSLRTANNYLPSIRFNLNKVSKKISQGFELLPFVAARNTKRKVVASTRDIKNIPIGPQLRGASGSSTYTIRRVQSRVAKNSK